MGSTILEEKAEGGEQAEEIVPWAFKSIPRTAALQELDDGNKKGAYSCSSWSSFT